ncbi:hypothetical protein H2200_013183 [Cladophialophora chaetospira]|uniref:AB hydrolase-1 domain-containing protein n=1 Tax=Cladophialophora chaetospira TaxID=386627 RepID=A0AA39CBH9_9EURO|nr:hypothetical protein H2200_013183 [Cladophialophora chaetospira]
MVHELPSPPKPTVVVIPGAACPSAHFYQPLCDVLSNTYNYTASTDDLPSASRAPPQTPGTLEDDVGVFHAKIAALVENGEDVVVVVHSYGGMVATDAVQGLARSERQSRGLKGGVVRIVYLTCIVAGVGETAGEVCERGGLKFKMESVGENGEYLTQMPGPISAQKVFSDLPLEEALLWQSRQSLQSAICYTGKCVYDAYRHIPITYIICTQDEVLTPEFQEGRVEFLRKEAKELDVVRMETGHCPNISALEETARVIVGAIEKGISKRTTEV